MNLILSGLSWAQVGTKLEPSWLQVKEILNFCQKPQAISDIMETVSWSNRTKFRNKYINLFLDLELIQMTIPDKPKSSKQKYQITQKGRLFFELLTDKK
jgi:ATP-dependent DNA helicase RecG